MKVIFTPIFALCCVALLFFIPLDTVGAATVVDSAETTCIIPDSGPWPPCATGGNNQSATNQGSTASNCIIPDTGPWPACATGGNHSTSSPTTNTDCVIPSSGPWPACATGGNKASESSRCIVPASGPWPLCATNNNNSSNNESLSPKIISFTATPKSCGTGCTNMLFEWQTTGTSYTQLDLTNNHPFGTSYNKVRVAGASGSYIVTFDGPANKDHEYRLTAYGIDKREVSQPIEFSVDCEYEMTVIKRGNSCAETPATATNILYQEYENGHVLSIDTPNPGTFYLYKFNDLHGNNMYPIDSLWDGKPVCCARLGKPLGDVVMSEGQIQSSILDDLGFSVGVSNVDNKYVVSLSYSTLFRGTRGWGWDK